MSSLFFNHHSFGSDDEEQIDYGYDDNGNLQRKTVSRLVDGATQTQVNNYVFDVRGQLRSVTTGGSSVGQFLCDSSGQRLRSQLHPVERYCKKSVTDTK